MSDAGALVIGLLLAVFCVLLAVLIVRVGDLKERVDGLTDRHYTLAHEHNRTYGTTSDGFRLLGLEWGAGTLPTWRKP